MRQNDLIKDILRLYDENLNRFYFPKHPSFVKDPIEHVVKSLRNDYGLNTKIFEKSSIYRYLDGVVNDLYSDGLNAGFQTGVDLSMLLMGYDPVYGVLPDDLNEKKN